MITEWTEEEGLETIVAMRPLVGSLADALPSLSSAMRARGTSLITLRRREYVVAMKHVTGRFFGFWKRTTRPREA